MYIRRFSSLCSRLWLAVEAPGFFWEVRLLLVMIFLRVLLEDVSHDSTRYLLKQMENLSHILSSEDSGG